MQRSHRLAFVLGGFAVALAVLGGAYAASGGGNQTNRPTAHSPAIVAGTSAGMPVTAQVLYAVVNADGTIARGLPRTGAGAPTGTHIAIGAYAVHFLHDITGCAYTATIGNSGSGNPTHGTIVVAARAGDPKGVFVETRDLGGALADHPFHVVVTC